MAANALTARLRQRRDDLEDELLNRIRAVVDRASPAEEAYLAELEPTVGAGLDYGFAAIERHSAGRSPELPDQLLMQARRAAQTEIKLDTVLRRYCAANSLFTDTLITEADRLGLPRKELKRAFRSLAISFDRLLAAITEEYERAAAESGESNEERRGELIERLLAGELIEGPELAYDFSAWHLGLVAFGLGAVDAVRNIVGHGDANLLILRRRDGVLWAWLGARCRAAVAERARVFSDETPEASVAVGEPAQGLAGWRLTHRQAVAALPLAIKGASGLASYSEAPLLVTALNDDLLASSLRRLYLAPLAEERDGGRAAKETLRAYFDAGGNVSSAAAALGVNRRTISARLIQIEGRLGCRLDAFSAEVQTALCLDALEQPAGVA
ncbi:MAG TPA: helix-turn-helix domain-containing protein [Solirubrobacterales bacterium]|nr:helix-turn-helix domain-containing protein [Solirubrobacterales bacterium]